LKFTFLKIFTILCLLTTISYAQSSITWQRTYVTPLSPPENFGEDLCTAENGNFYVIGSNSQPNEAYIIKINAYGDTIWSRLFDGCTGFAGTSTGDGGCIFTGDRVNTPKVAYTIKINSSGDTLWQKFYDQQYAMCLKIIKTFDGGYIACGRANYDYGYILKIDSLGNLQWHKLYQAGYSKVYNSISEAHNSGFVSVGFINNTTNDYGLGIVDRIDIEGNIIWEKTFEYKGVGVYLTSINKINNGYVMSGTVYDSTLNRNFVSLSRIDTAGILSYFKILTEDTSHKNYVLDMKVLSQNRFVFCTDEYNLTHDTVNAHVYITDSLGYLLKNKRFTGTDFTYLKRVLPLNNGDILFVGESDFANFYFENAYVVRCDSNLYVPPIGIRNINISTPVNFQLYQNYPNPFNPSTKIKFDVGPPLSPLLGKEGTGVVLTVYDILGRVVATLVNEKLNPGTYEITYDGSGLSSGIYFYKLQAGSFVQTRKMVLLK
jgi:hypothetical protein